MEILKKLNYLFDRKMKWKLVYLLVLILIGAGVELLGVSSILPVIQLGLQTDSVGDTFYGKWIEKVFNITEGRSILMILILFVICVYIFKNLYLYWMNDEICKFSMRTRKQLATRLMKAYMRQPYLYFLNKNTAEILRSLDSDVGQLYSVIQGVLMGVSCCITSLGILIYLMTTNIGMVCLVLVIFALVGLTAIKRIMNRLKKLGKESQDLVAEIIKYAKQSFEGIKEVKVLNREGYFVGEYNTVYTKQAEVGRRQTLYNLIPKYLIESVCIGAIMLYLAINVWLNDNFVEMIPQLAVFAVSAFKLLPTVNQLYSYLNGIMFNKASVDLVYRDIREVESYEDWQEDKERLSFQNSIQIKNVDFAYPDTNEKVLENVSLSIAKGDSIAMIGPSGGGKTTLVDIILGLLTPVAGEVRVDNQDIADNIRGWQKNIGYIPQSIYLIDDTIMKNVAFGVEEEQIDEEKVWKALESAQLKAFVEGLENGLYTNVGEQGTRISGGQRQRIGIARALYHNPEVLVFDEATSALDNATEKEVMEAIDGLKGSKTMIMIAHRLSTIENCDVVYKVEGKGVFLQNSPIKR